MRTLRFSGSSDDIFSIEGATVDEPREIDCFSRDVVVKIEYADQSMCVFGRYAPGDIAGCWVIGVMPSDEGIPIPDWNMRISHHENGYSTVLSIEVPATAAITVLCPKETNS